MILRITSNHSNTASIQPLLKDTGVNVLLKQNPQETNHWSTLTGTGLAPVVCHQMKRTKLLLPMNQSQATNTFYLHFKAPAAT